MFTPKLLSKTLILSILALSLQACEVEQIEPAKPESETEEPKLDESKEPVKPDSSIQNSEVIGKGSGDLIIKNVQEKKYSIKPGTYKSITIEKVSNISIDGKNSVKVSGGMIHIVNTEGVTLSGVTIENNDKGINISEKANNLTLKDLKLKNLPTYGISFKIARKYDGSESSLSKNIHLINIHADNVTAFFSSDGGIKNDGFYGLIRGFKLANSTIVNSPRLRSAVYLNAGEDYEISNNVVNNVNTANNDHNGIFHLKGNGKIFGNKISNHQGNGVRAWTFSTTKANSLVEIFDNIVYNSRRYSAFEVQVTPSIKNMKAFKPANSKIYNNTVGRMNTGQPKFYEGRVIDIYQTWGSVEVYNNLYFENRDNLVSLNHSNSKITQVKESNNKYIQKSQDAVIDLISFRSKHANIGARIKN